MYPLSPAIFLRMALKTLLGGLADEGFLQLVVSSIPSMHSQIPELMLASQVCIDKHLPTFRWAIFRIICNDILIFPNVTVRRAYNVLLCRRADKSGNILLEYIDNENRTIL